MALPSGREIGIVDVPGHARFMRNMLAGTHGLDAVMLVVAADEGVMPQTREHLEILDLLDVRRGLVALTKVDLVDKEWLELVSAEDLPAFQLVLGELPDRVPCVVRERTAVAQLASGAWPGTFALDLQAEVPVRIAWRTESEARKDELPVLEPAPLAPHHPEASLLEIQALVRQVEGSPADDVRLDNVASS